MPWATSGHATWAGIPPTTAQFIICVPVFEPYWWLVGNAPPTLFCYDSSAERTGLVNVGNQTLAKTRWRLQNAKLPRPVSPRVQKWRLRNAKYYPQAKSQYLDDVALRRLATWDKPPLHGDEWMEKMMGSMSDIPWNYQVSELDALETRATSSDGFCSGSDDGDGDIHLEREGVGCRQKTPAIAQSVANDLEPRTMDCKPDSVDFDGDWRCAFICNGTLTWKEGEDVAITVINRTSFRMIYVGKVYEARLLNDGKLQWDDGDVWARSKNEASSCEVEFDGEWRCAFISNGTLTWAEGEDVAITVISRTSFRMTYVGKVYEAWLLDDDQLQWDDGDLWRRPGDVIDEIPHQTPNAAQAEAKAPESRSRGLQIRGLRNQSRKQDLVPKSKAASSQEHSMDNASVRRPSGPCRQPKDLARTVHHARAYLTEPGRKTPAEKVLSYAAIATSQASAGDCARPTRGRSIITSEPLSEKRYEGIVKWFRGTYGWVYSADAQQQYASRDVFLHINDCCDDFRPKQGDAVSFLLSQDREGNPKAVRARPPPVMIDAREWFKKPQRSAHQ